MLVASSFDVPILMTKSFNVGDINVRSKAMLHDPELMKIDFDLNDDTLCNRMYDEYELAKNK